MGTIYLLFIQIWWQTHVNDAFCKMTGYTRQELMGRNLRMLNGPDTDVAAMAQLREAFTRGKDVRVVLKNYRKDGSAFWNELAMAPLRDKAGRLTHWVGIQTDASARIRVDEMASRQREAEETFSLQLKDKNETLASLETRRRFNEMLLNAITAGIIATDRDGRVVFINRAAQEVLQVSLADCLERPLIEVFGDSNEFKAELENLTEQRWTDFQLISAGGVLLHLGLTIMPAPDEFAGDLGLVVLFRDLGAGEMAEEAFAPSQTVETGSRGAVAGAGEGPPPSAPSASPAELSDPDADGFDWEALDIRELLESAVASLGWPEGPGLREPAADLAPVWSGREAATAVLMRLLELAVDIAQEASNVRLKLTPAQLGEDEQGPIAGLEIEFRLAQAGSAASERPDDFQGRIEEVAEWLHALGGAMLVPESDTSSLIFSAQLPVAQTG
jgi:PAS domain S-box-containing protein